MARILIFTYGTRGDVEPFMALALGLQHAGHKVTLATAEQFADMVARHGIAFAPISNASLDQIDSEDGKTMLEGGSGTFARIAAGIRLARGAGAINMEICQDAWRAAGAASPGLILYHPKMIAGPHIAEALGIPAILALLQFMVVPTSAFPATGLPRVGLPGFNRLTYRMVRMSFGTLKGSVNRFRRDTLELPGVRSAREVIRPGGVDQIKVLHAMSPTIEPRPDDWPDWAYMTGYWPLPPQPGYEPPAELRAFLDAGPPPAYVGFGSMMSRDAKALGKCVMDALRIAGARGVIGAGWAGLSGQGDDVITVRDVPHDWLFPRMAAVVHHGGAGTTAAGFRAGVPQVICPFFGDQPGWAETSVRLGVGATPVPRKRLTAETLAGSIREALSSGALQSEARRLAARLSAEKGIGAAISVIDTVLAESDTKHR